MQGGRKLKKTIIIIIVALVLIAAVALGLVWYFVWNDSAYIGRDAAKAAALADAGFSAQEVQRLKADFERDDGFVFYEVKFISGTTEYEYTIDASTGAVLHSETEPGVRLKGELTPPAARGRSFLLQTGGCRARGSSRGGRAARGACPARRSCRRARRG